MPFAKRISKFGGMVPKLSPRLLQDYQAQSATNLKVESGMLRPLSSLETIADFSDVRDGIKTIYKMTSGENTYWLTWEDEASVCKSPTINSNTYQILFWTGGPNPGLKYSWLSEIISSTPYPKYAYSPMVGKPQTAPTCTPSGGSGAQETRYFCYTYVTYLPDGSTFESPPSSISSAYTSYANASWDVTASSVAPLNQYAITDLSWSGGYLTLTCADTRMLWPNERVTLAGFAPSSLNTTWTVYSVGSPGFTIAMSNPGTLTDKVGTADRTLPHYVTGMKKRCYYTVCGSDMAEMCLVVNASTGAAYEIDVSSTTFNVTSSYMGGEKCPTVDYGLAFLDLHHIKNLPCGSLVGITGNRVMFSEPYVPYYWPMKYAITLDYEAVALGVFASSVIVWTKGQPYVLTGTTPETFTASKVDQAWPCVSSRGADDMGYAALAPTNNGLAMISSSGADFATKNYYTRDEWEVLNPDTMIATVHKDQFYCAYQYDETTNRMFVFSPDTEPYGLNLNASCLYSDAADGNLYVVIDDVIYRHEGEPGIKLTMEWRSKEYTCQIPLAITAAKIDGRFTMTPEEVAAVQAAIDAAIDANEAMLATARGSIDDFEANMYPINCSDIPELPEGDWNSVQFTLYVDGAVAYSAPVYTNKAVRLPYVGKYDTFSVGISSNIDVYSVVFAETMKALGSA